MIHLTDRIKYIIGIESDFIESRVSAYCNSCSVTLSESLSKDNKTLKFLIMVSPARKKAYCIKCARRILNTLIDESKATLSSLDSILLTDLFNEDKKKRSGKNGRRTKKK